MSIIKHSRFEALLTYPKEEVRKVAKTLSEFVPGAENINIEGNLESSYWEFEHYSQQYCKKLSTDIIIKLGRKFFPRFEINTWKNNDEDPHFTFGTDEVEDFLSFLRSFL